MNAILFLLMTFSCSVNADFQESQVLDGETISFTLMNRSNKGITLKFPGEPDKILGPKSKRKVNLNQGSKIYFFVKKKKYLLMSVKKNMKGKTILVDQLIKKRKLALGIK